MSKQRPIPSPLTIQPPSPDHLAPPPLVTPLNQISQPINQLPPSGSSSYVLSPSRRSTITASPTSSVHSSFAHNPPVPPAGGAGASAQPQGWPGVQRTTSLDVPPYTYGAGPAHQLNYSNSQSNKAGAAPVEPLDHGSAGGVNWRSPSKRDAGGKKHASAYDNKLVSKTLSHLPALPPISPTPTGSSTLPHALPTSRDPLAAHSVSALLAPQAGTGRGSLSATSSFLSPRPSLSVSSSAAAQGNHPSYSSSAPNGSGPTTSTGGSILLPDGSVLSTDITTARTPGLGTRVLETLAHSSANSPWSVLTVHVLPLFGGTPLKTPIEDLNQLCQAHILATSQRVPPSRLVAVLSSDLRDFIASGMLTLKAKFETVEEGKIIPRASEVWSLFWARILPYLEGIFLSFIQLRLLPPLSAKHEPGAYTDTSPIPVRQLLLSGFLIHIMLPLLPRLLPIISLQPNSVTVGTAPPSLLDLQRILQMSLVLSCQAKVSGLNPSRDPHERRKQDDAVRENVESLGKAVRWRMAMSSIPSSSSPSGGGHSELASTLPQKAGRPRPVPGHRRGPSSSQTGRYRRQGWKASTLFGQQWGQPLEHPSLAEGSTHGTGSVAQGGVGHGGSEVWGRQRLDEEDDEDDDVTPNQSAAPSNFGTTTNTARHELGTGGIGGSMSTLASTMGGLTVGTGTSGTLTPGASLIPSRNG